jgi:N-methylhydantoinase B
VISVGGPGTYRGGCGVVRDIRIIADEGILASRLENVIYPAWGVNGGHSGRPGRLLVNPGMPDERELKPLSDNNRLRQGDLLRMMTPGGGGWGDPLERDPARVRDDVLDGFVSLESARVDYGVVLDSNTLEVDEAATHQRRRNTPRQMAMFHRGRYLTDSQA